MKKEYSVTQIAERINISRNKVVYILEKLCVQPSSWVGPIRLYDEAVTKVLEKYFQHEDAMQKLKQGV